TRRMRLVVLLGSGASVRGMPNVAKITGRVLHDRPSLRPPHARRGEHAIRLLDELSAGQRPRWTLRGRRRRATPAETTEPGAEQEETRSHLTDSNRRPP